MLMRGSDGNREPLRPVPGSHFLEGFAVPVCVPIHGFRLHENKKKDLNNSLYQNHSGLKAKDGTRTRDIHLGKVELYH